MVIEVGGTLRKPDDVIALHPNCYTESFGDSLMRLASLLIAAAMTLNASPINAQAEDQGGPLKATEPAAAAAPTLQATAGGHGAVGKKPGVATNA